MPLKVRNWARWQTYRKDRPAPPWMKLHRNLLSNSEWACLSDAEKGQLVSIWLVAGGRGGEISEDSGVLRKICMLDSCPDLDKFVSMGFLESPDGCHDANQEPTNGCHDANQNGDHGCPRVEKRRVEKRREETTLSDEDIEPDDLINRFDELWTAYGYKAAKKDALKAYRSVVGNDENLHAKILTALPRYLSATDPKGGEKTQRKLLAGYLRSERFNDEVAPVRMASGKAARADAFMKRLNGSGDEDTSPGRTYEHASVWPQLWHRMEDDEV